MADDSLKNPACESPPDSRESEHRRRNKLQADLLKKAYDRHRHAAFIDAALRRVRDESKRKDVEGD